MIFWCWDELKNTLDFNNALYGQNMANIIFLWSDDLQTNFEKIHNFSLRHVRSFGFHHHLILYARQKMSPHQFPLIYY